MALEITIRIEPDGTYTPEQVAVVFATSRSTVINWAAENKLKAHRPTKRTTVFRGSEVIAFHNKMYGGPSSTSSPKRSAAAREKAALETIKAA